MQVTSMNTKRNLCESPTQITVLRNLQISEGRLKKPATFCSRILNCIFCTLRPVIPYPNMKASIRFVLEFFVLIHMHTVRSVNYPHLMIHKSEITGLLSVLPVVQLEQNVVPYLTLFSKSVRSKRPLSET